MKSKIKGMFFLFVYIVPRNAILVSRDLYVNEMCGEEMKLFFVIVAEVEEED